MFDFRKLQKVLERELSYQEKLLELLVHERAAIVRMNQDELDRLRADKEQLLWEMKELEERRRSIFTDLQTERASETPLKFADVLAICPPAEGKGQLQHVGDNLRKMAVNVKEMNEQNGVLIRQSLGLIASTIAIMTQIPEADLPTYSKKGAIKGPAADTSTIQLRPPISHEA
jgi:flagellar biosynthesis/type III secretory pathway chaperone